MVSLMNVFAVLGGLATIGATVIAILRVGRTWGKERAKAEARASRVSSNENDIERIETRLVRVEDNISAVRVAVEDLHSDIRTHRESDSERRSLVFESTGDDESDDDSEPLSEKWRDEGQDSGRGE